MFGLNPRYHDVAAKSPARIPDLSGSNTRRENFHSELGWSSFAALTSSFIHVTLDLHTRDNCPILKYLKIPIPFLKK